MIMSKKNPHTDAAHGGGGWRAQHGRIRGSSGGDCVKTCEICQQFFAGSKYTTTKQCPRCRKMKDPMTPALHADGDDFCDG